MMCYKGMTFCKSDCVNIKCHRYLSEEVRQGARRWWNHDPDNAPIAMADFFPVCEEYIKGNV